MNLIFLISQPRSGSTLLQKILSKSPDIATTSEPWISLHPIFSYKTNGISTVYNSKLAIEALAEFLKGTGKDLNFYKKQVSNFISTFYKEAIKFQHKKIL